MRRTVWADWASTSPVPWVGLHDQIAQDVIGNAETATMRAAPVARVMPSTTMLSQADVAKVEVAGRAPIRNWADVVAGVTVEVAYALTALPIWTGLGRDTDQCQRQPLVVARVSRGGSWVPAVLAIRTLRIDAGRRLPTWVARGEDILAASPVGQRVLRSKVNEATLRAGAAQMLWNGGTELEAGQLLHLVDRERCVGAKSEIGRCWLANQLRTDLWEAGLDPQEGLWRQLA